MVISKFCVAHHTNSRKFTDAHTDTHTQTTRAWLNYSIEIINIYHEIFSASNICMHAYNKHPYHTNLDITTAQDIRWIAQVFFSSLCFVFSPKKKKKRPCFCNSRNNHNDHQWFYDVNRRVVLCHCSKRSINELIFKDEYANFSLGSSLFM